MSCIPAFLLKTFKRKQRRTQLASIAFTYNPASLIGRVRLLSGDTDPAYLNSTGGDRTRTDSEIEALLDECSNDSRLAAAQLLEGKAAEFASQAMWVQQGSLQQDLRSRSGHMLKVAAELRSYSAAPVLFQPAQTPNVFTSGDDIF
jgi:hypothetical protein